MPRWVTLYTKPRMEHQVAEALLGRDVETYLPLVYEYCKPRSQRVGDSGHGEPGLHLGDWQ